jgi:hypothetical protein
VHPTFLYESLWNLLCFLFLAVLSRRGKRRFDGQYFLIYVGWYGLGRMLIEGLRTDSLYSSEPASRIPASGSPQFPDGRRVPDIAVTAREKTGNAMGKPPP